MGHERQKQYFERLITDGGFAHAYLFVGPQGIGKHALARELAGKLIGCAHASLEANPDFLSLMPGKSEETGKPTEIAVDDVRAMKQWAYVRPLYGARKIVLIDDAEYMSDAAANTFLKVLEEPPAYLHFILVSSRPGRLLSTIVSRCQDVAFQPLQESEMKTVLAALRLNARDAQLLAEIAAGRPGIALTLVREKKLSEVVKAIADLERMLACGVAERIVYAKTIADSDEALRIVSWWLAWAHASIESRPQLAPVAGGLLDLYEVLSEPKYNRRLAVEKFLIELPPV